jgi:CspA family cold shock protein
LTKSGEPIYDYVLGSTKAKTSGAKAMTGTVKWFNVKKRFGFITSDSGEDVFLHHSDIEGGIELQEGDKVEYETGESPKGKKAVNVKKI